MMPCPFDSGFAYLFLVQASWLCSSYLCQLIVAVEDKQIPQLQKLFDRGKENGVKGLTMVDKKGIKEIEPYCEVVPTFRY